MVKVELGAGRRTPEGSIGIDIRHFPGIDYVLDIGKDKLPFQDDSVDEIHADNVLEHLYSKELFFCIDECFRVIKSTGFLYVKVPEYGTLSWLINPDHKMHWNKDLFGFFQVPANGEDIYGYLKGFWHLDFSPMDEENRPPEAIWVKMYPNKPGSPYGYKEISD